jgi:hypothetical protein
MYHKVLSATVIDIIRNQYGAIFNLPSNLYLSHAVFKRADGFIVGRIKTATLPLPGILPNAAVESLPSWRREGTPCPFLRQACGWGDDRKRSFQKGPCRHAL